MPLARRQLQRVGLEAALDHLHRGAVAIQVIALGDRPVDLDPAAFARACLQRKGLVDGQQLVSLMIQYRVGVEVKQTYSVVEIDDDYFT